MKSGLTQQKSIGIKIGSILRARCPSCHIGGLLNGGFSIRPKCLECNYNFHPEPGFYVGAMAISFLITAVLTVPPMIALKFFNVDINVLIFFPFVEFAFLGTFLMFYSRIIWLHLEYRLTDRLDGHVPTKDQTKVP